MIFLFGGERPPNKKVSFKSKRALFAAHIDEMQLLIYLRRARVNCRAKGTLRID
jgi:hypothetical protein